MSDFYQKLAARVQTRFANLISGCRVAHGELSVDLPREHLIEVSTALRDEAPYAFVQLIDLCGVDYLEYGSNPWTGPRFAVVYHLLSLSNDQRIRLRVFLNEDSLLVSSIISVWSSANWYEREAFDLYGIVFEGHPDLRRILTDYGFVGHPFRKDFPLIGNVEMRYDPEKRRVVYEPVSITPRITVPRIIRQDNRYLGVAGKGD